MAQLKLNLVKDAKNRKSSYRYVHQKKKVIESVALVVSKAGKLVTMGTEKAEVLNSFFPQSSMAVTLSTHLEWMDSKTGAGEAKSFPLLEKISFVTTSA